MTLFLLTFALLLVAAAGVAVGALRGRPLPGGPCAVRAVEGVSACGSCAAAGREEHERPAGDER
jgi:hypothetical protein